MRSCLKSCALCKYACTFFFSLRHATLKTTLSDIHTILKVKSDYNTDDPTCTIGDSKRISKRCTKIKQNNLNMLILLYLFHFSFQYMKALILYL